MEHGELSFITAMSESDDRNFASPPCFMHEFEEELLKPTSLSDPTSDVAQWRKAERERLITVRRSIPTKTRQSFTEKITAGLDNALSEVSGQICSFYWPFRGEPDLRPMMERIHHRGGICALPCVVVRNKPMIFRVWKPNAKMEKGIWNIPVPAGGTEVIPDIVIAPLVGFDRTCYRLGYGGGYFDRTLATMATSPRVLGVGFAQTEVATIHPQEFDIPMDLIVTEDEIIRRANNLSVSTSRATTARPPLSP